MNYAEVLGRVTAEQWERNAWDFRRRIMHVCTVTYGQLSVGWDSRGTLTIARTDLPQSVQLSLSEWSCLLKICELRDWPVVAPANLPTQSA